MEKLENTDVSSNAILVTLNVESLYTDIKNEVGIAAVRYFLISKLTPTECITR